MFRVYMVWISGAWMSCASRQPGSPVFHIWWSSFSSSCSFIPRRSQGVRTARSQSRYELSTRFDASSQFAARRVCQLNGFARGLWVSPYIGAFAAQGMWG